MAFQGWTIVLVALAYIGLLFGVAWWGDRRFGEAKGQRRPRPLVYALSLAVYCTSWTYFGSVGVASRTGYDFVPVYLGPILMFALGYPLIARIVAIAKRQNIASIADFLAARYGKNEALGAIVALIAVIGIVPYISIQLKALSFSLQTMIGPTTVASTTGGSLAFFITMALAAFAVLFGTRHVDATEHQDGLMSAIAVESLVKLGAFVTVGLFVTFAVAGGPSGITALVAASPAATEIFSRAPDGSYWLTVTLLSACSIILLPRQFHVAVVENAHVTDVRRAAWLFPLYLVLINLFVLPIAIVGLTILPNVDADTYVLALPVASDARGVALIAFIGGISAATAMVIVECVALAIMVSNNLVVPLVLLLQGEQNMFQVKSRESRSPALITIRRVIICVILVLSYAYFAAAGNSAAIAQTGLISFAALTQLAPAFFGGLIWHRATARGAMAGILAGFTVWAYTLLIPSFIDSGWISKSYLDEGLLGIAALKPRQLFGLAFDPLPHGVFWSLAFNIACYIGFSLMKAPSRVEQLQAQAFISADLQRGGNSGYRLWRSTVAMGAVEDVVARYLGREPARAAFADLATRRELADDPSIEADIVSLTHAENLIASAVGPASSRLVMALLLERHAKGSRVATQLLDDASTAVQHSRELLQSAIDNVPQGIAVFTRNNELICWNPPFCVLLNIPDSMARVGSPLRGILSHVMEQTGPVSDLGARLSAALEHVNGDHAVMREKILATGRVVDVQSGVLPDGGLVLTFIDVSENVEAAEVLRLANETLERRVRERTAELTTLNDALAIAKAEAEQANIGKTRFIAAASHDILQPLNAARLFTSTLVEQKAKGQQGQLARNVDQSLEAVEDILATVLDISRFDAGAVKPEISSFRASDILKPLQQEFAPLAQAKGLSLVVVGSSLVLRSDRKLLRRILQNLMSNAITYTSEGRVLVGLKRNGDHVQIRVHDTGPGIPQSKHGIIFHEFERLSHGASPEKGGAPGLGLGLSIVERLTRLLGHPMALQSHMGQGSLFSVMVPISEESVAEPVAKRPANPRLSGALSGLHVLAIDNEQSIVDGLAALLGGWGLDVSKALNPVEAMVADRKPDIIIADYHINRDDGLALIQELRDLWKDTVPAILITADPSAKLRGEAEAAGVHYLRKPVKPAQLRALMAQLAVQGKAAE